MVKAFVFEGGLLSLLCFVGFLVWFGLPFQVLFSSFSDIFPKHVLQIVLVLTISQALPWFP